MKHLLIITTASILAATPAFGQTLFLDDATVIAPDGSSRTADIVLADGQISAMADELTAPENVESLSGVWVTPGLINPKSTLGLVDVGGESATNDISAETELASASLRAADSFNPRAVHIANARRRGIMYAAVVPNAVGDSIFGGVGLIANLDGTNNSVLDDAALMHIALGETGSRRAGGSRAAAIAQLRGALADVRRGFRTQDEGDTLRRRDAEALRPVLAGRIPLLISASRASDLMNIIKLKDDFSNLDIIILGAEEAHLVAEELASAGIKVIVDPIENLPSSFDSVNASYDNVLVLDSAGVDYAISNLSSQGVTKAGGLMQHVGNAVGNGLSRNAAFASVLSTPARWFDINLGDIRTGNAASLIVWDGDPLEAASAPIAMYKNGETLSLESRMTALRDRYNPLLNDDRPHKYR